MSGQIIIFTIGFMLLSHSSTQACEKLLEIRQKEIILITEDQDFLLKNLKNFLDSQKKYEVFITQTEEEAVKRLDTQINDLLLTDLQIPNIGGIGIMDYINEQALSLSSIVMTGYASQEVAFKALKLQIIHLMATTLNHRLNNSLNAIKLANEKITSQHGFDENTNVIERNIEKINRVIQKLSRIKNITEIEYIDDEKMIDLE